MKKISFQVGDDAYERLCQMKMDMTWRQFFIWLACHQVRHSIEIGSRRGAAAQRDLRILQIELDKATR